MQPPVFHVQLRLWPDSFANRQWQKELPADLLEYLHFYKMATPEAPTVKEAKAGWVEVEGLRCWLQAYRPQTETSQAGTLLHLHGYYDHGALYPSLQQWALQKGLHYLAVDLPGHGLSSGARASIRNFNLYQQLLAALLEELEQGDFPRPWLVTGFSTGGAIALEQLLTRPRFDAVALLAPLIHPLGWVGIRRWLPWVSLLFKELPRKYRANCHNEEFLQLVKEKDPMQSQRLSLTWVKALARWIPRIEKSPPCGEVVMIIQGEGDTTVDWSYNLSVLNRLLPEAQVVLLPDTGHQLLNEEEKRRQAVFKHLDLWLENVNTRAF
ncbi:alpha/beta hydrolase [Marinospirillum perlucidum]|uniref:alpha/beta hydrolase n=1 Tax=Marinospirillum perlucidum TaxID=1982602 RepID=UPI000DF39667|nr:alpha/beta hydrolase [Marinospirillum perlucidum]